jgi:hypothetical protein
MLSFFKRTHEEKGQVLPAALALLMFGSLTVVTVLNHATTSLNASQMLNERIDGRFAADAGVEYAYWCLDNDLTPPSQLPESINQMTVGIQIEEKGSYTLYFGEFVPAQHHSDYLDTEGNIAWDDDAGAYKYSISVTWQPHPGTPTIHIEEMGAKIPPGYIYELDSAAAFADNISTDEPDIVEDGDGAYMVNWDFSSPLPYVTESEPTLTQYFYITHVSGDGELEGDYTWVVANRQDIGAVGEISGGLFLITSVATQLSTSETKSTIRASVMEQSDETSITSWQILR